MKYVDKQLVESGVDRCYYYFFIKSWKTSGVSISVWMVETQYYCGNLKLGETFHSIHVPLQRLYIAGNLNQDFLLSGVFFFFSLCEIFPLQLVAHMIRDLRRERTYWRTEHLDGDTWYIICSQSRQDRRNRWTDGINRESDGGYEIHKLNVYTQ